MAKTNKNQELLDRIAGITHRDDLDCVLPAARSRLNELREQVPDPGNCDTEPNDCWYIEAARDLYHRDDDIEIDENAEVSNGADNGAYVQAWVWVEKPDYADEEDTDDPDE